MLEHWVDLEGDFRREYGINLGVAVWSMPWREFTVLMRGLSPTSLWALAAHEHAQRGAVDRSKPTVLTGDQAGAYFRSIGKPAKAGR